MANPLSFIAGAVKGVAAVAQGLGKAKGIAERAMDDLDGDGLPQYQNIINGGQAIYHRFTKDTLALARLEFGEYKKMFAVLVPQVKELVLHIFNDAQAKAKAGK